MFVDVRGTLYVLGALALAVALAAIDLHCSGDGAPGGAIDRVKHEAASGRAELAVIRRDRLAEQLRTLRALNRRCVEQGNLAESRRLTLLILDVERQYRKADERVSRLQPERPAR